jgi:RNA polymerase sigma-70 factor (sigma-E family)
MRTSLRATESDFESFARTSIPRLLGLARLLVGPSDAEDLVQEALTTAHRKWRLVRRANDPHAYACRMLINQANSDKRKRKVVTTNVDDAPELPTGRTEPDLLVERLQLQESLTSLPYRQRTAVVLRFYMRMSARDIADCMGIEESTARSLISRGVAHLRTQMSSVTSPDLPPIRSEQHGSI